MSTPTWALRIIRKAFLDRDLSWTAAGAKCLLNEHRRTLRVLATLEKRARLDKHSMDADQFDAYIQAIEDARKALTKGRP
jgi:hypothetical protein